MLLLLLLLWFVNLLFWRTVTLSLALDQTSTSGLVGEWLEILILVVRLKVIVKWLVQILSLLHQRCLSIDLFWKSLRRCLPRWTILKMRLFGVILDKSELLSNQMLAIWSICISLVSLLRIDLLFGVRNAEWGHLHFLLSSINVIRPD